MIQRTDAASRAAGIWALVLVSSVFVTGCKQRDPVTDAQSETTLHIGFGLTTGERLDAGMRETARSIAVEGLMSPANDGRLQARLAEQLSVSEDHLRVVVRLRRGVTFHDATPVSAEAVRAILADSLPEYLGPAFDDVAGINVSGPQEIELTLKRPSNFVLEGLDVPIQKPATSPIGTGPFFVSAIGEQVEMRANDSYHAGRPLIDRIVFRPYASVRSALADMLRGQVDMLYDVGIDALDLLRPSTQTQVFSFGRPYAFIAILNVNKGSLREPRVRRALNAAVNRAGILSEALQGHGAPAEGPVWPGHWAHRPELPRFHFAPEEASESLGGLRFTCLYSDPTHERIALVLQKQLQAVGVDMALEALPVDDALERVRTGNFDAFLADASHGPTLIRSYFFWRSGSPFNWGTFRSAAVDRALGAINHAMTDDAYVRGVAAFQAAIVDDPPAIFLAWSERARAVSTRFEVPAEPGRDILSTLRLWRPAVDKQAVN